MELAIVAIIALVVFGPSKLPELGSSLGKGMREFKASISGDNSDERKNEQAVAARLEATSGSTGATPVRADPKPADA
jgi:sec-independent protein translocase protein TatA